MNLRKAAEQALESMLNFPDDISDDMFGSIIALKAALAEPDEQDGNCKHCENGFPACDARYVAAVAAEREACAKVCEEMWTGYGDLGAMCAAAIRARGDDD